MWELLQLSVKISRVLVARVRSPAARSNQCSAYYSILRYSRSRILLRVPLGGTLEALAGFTQVVELLQVDLANLLLAVGSLPEATSLGQVRDCMRKSLHGDCATVQL